MMNQRQDKARRLRYKRAMLDELNLDAITDEFLTIQAACDEVRYYIDNDESLLNALDGNEEEEYEFKMMFSDLSGECDKLYYMLADECVTEHFDDFMALIGGGGRYRMIGYDDYEADYFALMGYETELAKDECGKRVKRLTKDEMISTAAQCFGIIVSFFDIRYRYDYLKAAFDVLRDDNTSYLAMIKDIDKAYERADAALWAPFCDEVKEFERRVNALPGKAWAE